MQYDPMQQSNKIIHVCSFCGEYCTGATCPTCKTKPQRKEKLLAQLAIEKARDYATEKLFGFKREALLECYGIK